MPDNNRDEVSVTAAPLLTTSEAARRVGLKPQAFERTAQRLGVAAVPVDGRNKWTAQAASAIAEEFATRQRIRQAKANARARQKEAEERNYQEFVRRLPRAFSAWREALPLCCQGMCRLNQWAKTRGCDEDTRSAIYALKNRLSRVLYDLGLAVEVARQDITPERPCIRCRGRPGRISCECCGGEGYVECGRSVACVAFRFSVGGQVYAWRQPVTRIDWPLEYTTATALRLHPERPPDRMPGHYYRRAIALVTFVVESASSTPVRRPAEADPEAAGEQDRPA
jgi:hypothetical protein